MRFGYQAKRLQDVVRALRRGRATTERERWSREQLEAFQQDRLERLVAHARRRSRFWADRLPERSARLEDLPILDKAEMMSSFDDLVTDRRLRRDELMDHLARIDRDELYLGEYRVMATSGSSGFKGLYVYDRAAWVELQCQFMRCTAWAGTSPRLPRRRIAAIGGAAPTHMTQRLAASMDVGLHRIRALAVTARLPLLVEELNAFRPNFLNAYPSMAVLLAEEQLAGRLRLDLEGMSTSSEPLMPEARERLERAFEVRPFNLYGTTEGVWGCECEAHAGIHLFEDMCIVENVDENGRPAPDGEPGSRLLVTNLFNYAQPLIRFELTDVTTLEPAACPCGRTLGRLGSLEGRSADIMRLGGVAVHPMQFGFITADRDVREFQVVQEGQRLRLRLALRDGANGAAARLRGRLRQRLRALAVPDPAIEVEEVERLDRSPAGKLQVVVADPRER